MQDPREYFDSQQANALKTLGDNGSGMKPMDCNLSAEEAWIYLIGQISQVKVRGFNHPIVQSEAALKVYLSQPRWLCAFVEKKSFILSCYCYTIGSLNLNVKAESFLSLGERKSTIECSFCCW